MADKHPDPKHPDQGPAKAPVRTLISQAFEGDHAPPQLSVAIVSLVELCQFAMPDPEKLRANILGAGFEAGKQKVADEFARPLALDSKLVATPIRNLRHEIFGRMRHDEPVIFLLSVADSDKCQIVFCSALFRGAIEADAVKAAAHVTKKSPFGGGMTANADGAMVRRAFWDLGGEAGIRGLAVSGPENVEDMQTPRAFIAFNQAGARG